MDTKKNAYLKTAALEAGAAASDDVAEINDSKMGEMANAMIDATHSKKQESQAHTYL